VGQLSQLLRRDEQIKTKMKNASIYPAIVLSLGIISVVVMVTFILPRIVENVSGGAAALPLLTKVFLAMSDFLKSYGWLVLIGCIAIPYGFLRWISTEAGRVAWDRFKLRVPVLGNVLVTVAVGRFARTLGALTKGGVTILESLAVVRDTLGNEILAREIDGVAEKVKTGQPLAEALSQSGTFPPLLIQITAVGEQTGQLDDLLLNAAETFDETADAAIARFMAIMPPMLILILAVLIGLIIAAALLPIFDMDLAGGI
jgi:type II secretory pathway component PulF